MAWSVGTLVDAKYAILIQEALQLSRDEVVLVTNEMLDTGRKLVTMACFLDYGTIAVESNALIMCVITGHRALMFCLRSDVGSGSSSHDLIADAKSSFKTQ